MVEIYSFKNKVKLMESEFSRGGSQLIPPVQTPIGKLGLSICYDVRFAELALWNRQQGAEVLSFPSAFTLNTGLAHWEVCFFLGILGFLTKNKFYDIFVFKKYRPKKDTSYKKIWNGHIKITQKTQSPRVYTQY
jgi:hypothetical protein